MKQALWQTCVNGSRCQRGSVTERGGSSVTADFLTGDAPDASVWISQWDSSFKEKSAD